MSGKQFSFGRSRRSQIGIIIVCLLVLAVFEGLYLNRAYEKAKFEQLSDVKRQILFNQRVWADSLKFNLRIKELVNAFTEVIPLFNDSLLSEIGENTFESKGLNNSIRITQDSGNIKQVYSYSFHSDSEEEIQDFVDSIKLAIDLGKGKRFMSAIKSLNSSKSEGKSEGQTHRLHRISGPEGKRKMVVDTAFLNRQMENTEEPTMRSIKFRWTLKDSADDEGALFPGAFILENDQKTELSLELDGLQKSTLNIILPDIFLCILLLLLVGLTLLLFYRNAERNRKLILLKNELISNISHELKTPVSSVKIALESIRRKGREQDAQTINYLNQSEREVTRLQFLIDKVLQSSLLEEKNLQLAKESVDLIRIVENCKSHLSLLAEEKGIKILVECKQESLSCQGDSHLLEHSICNLLENAIKYGPEGKPVTVEFLKKEDNILIRVKDLGKGVEPEYIQSIFDRFFRSPSNDIHNVKGHGLGLHFVKSVIEQHGGSVSAKNLNPGFSVQVKLPIHG